MTRVNVVHPVPCKPTSIALSELAIAAGAGGHSITLCYWEFPAPVLCQLWQYCIRYIGLGEVHHLRTQADVRELAKIVSYVRLALVYSPRLCNAASWAIRMAPATEDRRRRLFAQAALTERVLPEKGAAEAFGGARPRSTARSGDASPAA
jgi:hypothetical protein